MGMEFERKLAIPAEVKEMYPLTGKMRETVEKHNAQIKKRILRETIIVCCSLSAHAVRITRTVSSIIF